MATKKVNFNQKGIEKLPNDKPVLYKIQTEVSVVDKGNQLMFNKVVSFGEKIQHLAETRDIYELKK